MKCGRSVTRSTWTRRWCGSGSVTGNSPSLPSQQIRWWLSMFSRRQKEKRVTPESQGGPVSPLSCYSFNPGQSQGQSQSQTNKLHFPYDHLVAAHQVKSEADWEASLALFVVVPSWCTYLILITTITILCRPQYIYQRKETNQKAKWSKLVVKAWPGVR